MRDTLLIFALTFAGGVVLGLIGASLPQIAILNGGLILLGFVIVGYLVRDGRTAHFAAVTVALWLASFVNVLLGIGNVLAWVGSLVLLAACAVVGAGLSTLLFQRGGRS